MCCIRVYFNYITLIWICPVMAFSVFMILHPNICFSSSMHAGYLENIDKQIKERIPKVKPGLMFLRVSFQSSF